MGVRRGKRSRTTRLLAFARELQHAATFRELLEVARQEAHEATGFGHAWLFVAESDDARELKLIDIAGAQNDLVWEVAPVLCVEGDAMLEQIVASDEPVVVFDARTDARTDKKIVEALGNRTIVNIPLRLLDKPFGAFGVGTFGDEEGCREPTSDELDYLIGMASQLSVAAGRIRFLEERARSQAQTRELEHQLYEAQKLESLGLLAGGAAHDFNNLLTIILSGAELARMSLTTSPAQVERELDVLVGAAERGRELTRQLLAMSRRQALKLTSVDVGELLQRLVEMLRRVLPDRVEVVVTAEGDLPLVEGDPSQLDQVFMNLCINARDAMPSGGRLVLETKQVVIDVAESRKHPWAKPGRYVLTTVSDTGVGMTPEVSERVFEPFFTTKRETGGTGLGLAVVRGIVRRHSGAVQCRSTPGLGTSMEVYLPAVASTTDVSFVPRAGPAAR